MLKLIMEKAKESAQSGDAAACAELMAGATEQPSGSFVNTASFGRHRFVIDEPADFGGTDTAANPAEIMLGAIGASIAVTLRGHAALMDIAVGKVRVELSGALDTRGFFDVDTRIRAGFTDIDIRVCVETDAGPETLEKLNRQVLRSCPVLDACRNPTPVTMSFTTA